MGLEVIAWDTRRAPGQQSLEGLGQFRPVYRSGIIEIDFCSEGRTEVRTVPVKVIQAEHGCMRPKPVFDGACEPGFSRAAPACDTNQGRP